MVINIEIIIKSTFVVVVNRTK